MKDPVIEMMPDPVASAAVLYVASAIMLCVAGAWGYLILSMRATFRLVPYLDDDIVVDNPYTEKSDVQTCDKNSDAPDPRRPRVSVILPARNEAKYIGRCLESLSCQDYQNYEVVVVDDSSDDDTPRIISEHAARHPEIIVHVSARPKPAGWMGKNWACMEGYARARGDLLLFTDADTRHAKNVINLAVLHLTSKNLDALTVMPRMLAPGFWVKVALPMISVFLHTRFSALKVNSPKSKTGYFFGSFFIIRRHVYSSIGMHNGVRGEMIEDGALGRKTKESGFRMRMVRGEHLVEAVWARDGSTLWNALKRLMIPLRAQNGLGTAVGIATLVSFLLFAPFAMLAVSVAFLPIPLILQSVYSAVGNNMITAEPISGIIPVAPHMAVAALSGMAASLMIWTGATFESRTGLGIGALYGLFAPLGGLVVSAGFIAGLARSNPSLVWRGRVYAARDISSDQFAAI